MFSYNPIVNKTTFLTYVMSKWEITQITISMEYVHN